MNDRAKVVIVKAVIEGVVVVSMLLALLRLKGVL